MKQILLAYGVLKEIVAAITILNRNTKVKVRSPDGDTEYFDIVAGVLQGDTLAPYPFITCLDYFGKIKENGIELTKKRSRRYPVKIITDADYADDIAILANTPNQAETLGHSLERAAAGIGLHINAHKTEYMCFNQTGDISTLDGTEKDIDTWLTNAWTDIDRLSIIWKSDLTDKMKQFLPGSGRVDTAVWMHYLDANKTAGEEARRQLHKNVESNIEYVLVATSHKAPTIQPPASHRENYPSYMNSVQKSSWETPQKM